jgi:hypothetical protein
MLLERERRTVVRKTQRRNDQPGDEEGRIKLKPMDKPMNKPSNRISKIPSMSILRIPRMRDKCDNSMDD